MSICLAVVVMFSVQTNRDTAYRSELDEPDTTIDKWSIGVCYSPCCPRPSQTADQRFGNIWSDNILSSFTAQTGHWSLRDFPRTTMHDDWFDKHCAHTMVNTTGRVAVLVEGRYAPKAGMLNLSVSPIIFDFMQNEFLFSLLINLLIKLLLYNIGLLLIIYLFYMNFLEKKCTLSYII